MAVTGPEAVPGPDPDFQRYFAVARFSQHGSLTFSPGGDEVAYAHDGSGQFNLYRQSVAGGPAHQLTHLVEDAARHHLWTPLGLVVGVDHHGDEQWQLNLLPEAGGELADLTGRRDAQFVPGHVHPDGRQISFSGNGTRPTSTSAYVLELEGRARRPLVEDEGNWAPGPWHPDGRRVVVSRFLSNTDQQLYLLDEADGGKLALTPHEGEELNRAVGFGAGGRHLYRITDRGHEFTWLAEMDLETGAQETIWKGAWDVEQACLSEDGRRLVWAVNEDGRSRIRGRDLAAGEDLTIPDLPSGWCLHVTLSPHGRRLAAVIGTATRPFDVYVADLETGSVTRLTHSFQGGVEEADMVEPDLVRLESFDGRPVPAWLYRPRGTGGPVPVLLSIHGGPEAQERPGAAGQFSFYQWLASRGIAVLAPNIRGSTGYGKSYQRLIHRDWGGGELRDIEACARWLGAQPWADAQRVGVYGGSFGGFATLSAMSRLPDYWACGVDLVGPSNLVTFARAVPPYWREMIRAWVGDPDDDAGLLAERSPITYVEQIRAPLLVLQGARDPRVVKPESDQLVERLRQLGRQVEYHVFDDEGHGFTKNANALRAYQLIGRFLFRHLAPAAG